MTESSFHPFHPDSLERMIAEGYPRTHESEAFDALPPPPASITLPPRPLKANTPQPPPSHCARTATQLIRWVGKSGKLPTKGGLACPIVVVDARVDFGRVLVLVKTPEPGAKATDWVITTSIRWPFTVSDIKE